MLLEGLDGKGLLASARRKFVSFIVRLAQQAGEHSACAWFESAEFKIYTRVTYRIISNIKRRTIDLANVFIAEANRGKGLLTEILNDIHSMCRLISPMPYAIFLECVHDPRLQSGLIDRGFIQIEGTCPPSFFKETKCSQPRNLVPGTSREGRSSSTPRRATQNRRSEPR